MVIGGEDYPALLAGGAAGHESGLPGGAATQAALWRLLAWQTARYTMGESTSIPEETAGKLLRSLCFTLELGLSAGAAVKKGAADEDTLRGLYSQGLKEAEARVKDGRALLRRVEATAPGVTNLAYEDTLQGLGTFFRRYDFRFFAHEIPGDIDYQLCLPVPGKLEGICYIQEYLTRLLAENLFLQCFATADLRLLLEKSCPQYRQLLINLYEPAAVNALGLALLEEDIFPLRIAPGQLKPLEEQLTQDPWQALERAARRAARRLPEGRGAQVEAYLTETAWELAPRLKAALEHGNLSGIFLDFEGEKRE